MRQFYGGWADEYRLMFADWKDEVRRQGDMLDTLIRRHLGVESHFMLDYTRGIRTQAISLAGKGHMVHATDLRPAAVEHAMKEAVASGVSMTFDVADIRMLESKVPGNFDVVLSCDNALSHLLTDADLLQAARQMRRMLRPDGLLLISIEDYDQVVRGGLAKGAPVPGLPAGSAHAG